MATHVALCSGGRDSAVATHASVRFGPADRLVYLDTGTGLAENRRYVETLADALGVPIYTIRTPESYERLVREHGFPGPSRHFIMYQRLKDRQLCDLASMVGGDLHCWTGIRRLESDRRLRHVTPESERGDGRWYWRAPLCDWPEGRVTAYLDRFDLPRNELWDTLGRSGDCYCGCFATREELYDLEAAGCGERADAIRQLEASVDAGDETDRWAWWSLSDAEQRAARVDGGQLTLCSSCLGGGSDD